MQLCHLDTNTTQYPPTTPSSLSILRIPSMQHACSVPILVHHPYVSICSQFQHCALSFPSSENFREAKKAEKIIKSPCSVLHAIGVFTRLAPRQMLCPLFSRTQPCLACHFPIKRLSIQPRNQKTQPHEKREKEQIIREPTHIHRTRGSACDLNLKNKTRRRIWRLGSDDGQYCAKMK